MRISFVVRIDDYPPNIWGWRHTRSNHPQPSDPMNLSYRPHGITRTLSFGGDVFPPITQSIYLRDAAPYHPVALVAGFASPKIIIQRDVGWVN